jgi:hypothetical protein
VWVGRVCESRAVTTLPQGRAEAIMALPGGPPLAPRLKVADGDNAGNTARIVHPGVVTARSALVAHLLMVAALAAIAVLAGIAVSDAARARGARLSPPSPPR